MNFNDCVAFAKENPLCALATMDGDQPRVRTFYFWFADEKSLNFMTLAPKKVVAQIKKNPKVEICFYNQEKSLRVTGRGELIVDVELAKKQLAVVPPLPGKGPEDPIYLTLRVSKGEAFFWTMDDRLKEDSLERIRF